MTQLLFSTKEITHNFEQLEHWKQDAYNQLSNMLSNNEKVFPCLPAQIGFSSDHLRYAFIEDPRKSSSIKELGNALVEYGKCSRNTGKYASFVVFFHLQEPFSILTYEQIFWETINHLHTIDTIPWPSPISVEPHDETWEFCFHGEPYFSFCSTPAHKKRLSRYFPYFLIAFQPRWVFEELNGSTIHGQTMKKVIRDRLMQYDDVDVHPSLKWYGQEDNFEWKQYFLRDDQSSPLKCPFSSFFNKTNSHQQERGPQ